MSKKEEIDAKLEVLEELRREVISEYEVLWKGHDAIKDLSHGFDQESIDILYNAISARLEMQRKIQVKMISLVHERDAVKN